MHDIPSLFSLNTSKTHEKHAKTHVTHWHARYSTTFQSKHEQNTRKACQNPRNSLTCKIFHHFSAKRPRKTRAISSFAGTCNTFPRVRTRALNKQTNKRTNEQTNKRTNEQTNKKRNREKTENVISPFVRPSSLLNHRKAMDINKCKFFKDKNFVFSTTVIS